MISQKQKMKMQQKLTPQQLMLMSLLQLPVTSLEQRIKEEMEKNPMLEVDSNQNTESDYNDTDSRPNDDSNDNRFNPPVGRFPAIEEDEPPYRLLCNEYPASE